MITLLKNDYKDFFHPHIQNKKVRVYRLYYLEDVENKFGSVKANTVGGYLESESNFDLENPSIILNQGMVFGQAITRNSMIKDYSAVFDETVLDTCESFGKSRIFGKTKANNSIFRDNCSIGGILTIKSSYFSNSVNVSGLCKIFNCKMYVGSRISGQSDVYDTTLTDTSEITGVSRIRNCVLTGRTVLKNEHLENQSISEDIELNILSQKGDLFP